MARPASPLKKLLLEETLALNPKIKELYPDGVAVELLVRELSDVLVDDAGWQEGQSLVYDSEIGCLVNKFSSVGEPGEQGPQGKYRIFIYQVKAADDPAPDTPTGGVVVGGVLSTPPVGWTITFPSGDVNDQTKDIYQSFSIYDPATSTLGVWSAPFSVDVEAGPPGPAGATGQTGPPGETGPAGPRGLKGDSGNIDYNVPLGDPDEPLLVPAQEHHGAFYNFTTGTPPGGWGTVGVVRTKKTTVGSSDLPLPDDILLVSDTRLALGSVTDRRVSKIVIRGVDYPLNPIYSNGDIDGIPVIYSEFTTSLPSSGSWGQIVFHFSDGTIAPTAGSITAVTLNRQRARDWLNIEQANWTETDENDPSYIKNKPEITSGVTFTPTKTNIYNSVKAILKAGPNVTITPSDTISELSLSATGGSGGGNAPGSVVLAPAQTVSFGVPILSATTLTTNMANGPVFHNFPSFSGAGVSGILTATAVSNIGRVTVGRSGYVNVHFLDEVEISRSTAGGGGRDAEFALVLTQYGSNSESKREWIWEHQISDPITTAIRVPIDITTGLTPVEVGDYFTLNFAFNSAVSGRNITFNLPADNPGLDERLEFIFFGLMAAGTGGGSGSSGASGPFVALDTQPTDLSSYVHGQVLRINNPAPGKWGEVQGANSDERHGFRVEWGEDSNNLADSALAVGGRQDFFYSSFGDTFGKIWTEDGLRPLNNSKTPLMRFELQRTKTQTGFSYGVVCLFRKTALKDSDALATLYVRGYSGEPSRDNELYTIELTKAADNPLHDYHTYLEKTGSDVSVVYSERDDIEYLRFFSANPPAGDNASNPLNLHEAKSVAEIDPPNPPIPSRTTFPDPAAQDAPQRFILAQDIAAVAGTLAFPTAKNVSGGVLAFGENLNIERRTSPFTVGGFSYGSVPPNFQIPGSYEETNRPFWITVLNEGTNGLQLKYVASQTTADFKTANIPNIAILSRNSSGEIRRLNLSNSNRSSKGHYNPLINEIFPYRGSGLIDIAVIDTSVYSTMIGAVTERKAGEYHLIGGQYYRIETGRNRGVREGTSFPTDQEDGDQFYLTERIAGTSSDSFPTEKNNSNGVYAWIENINTSGPLSGYFSSQTIWQNYTIDETYSSQNEKFYFGWGLTSNRRLYFYDQSGGFGDFNTTYRDKIAILTRDSRGNVRRIDLSDLNRTGNGTGYYVYTSQQASNIFLQATTDVAIVNKDVYFKPEYTVGLYEKVGGSYIKISNTNPNTGIAVLTGTGAPATTLGVNGNFYLDTTARTLYFKNAGAWVAIMVASASGLTQTQVDARVNALIENWAKVANSTTRLPKAKLPTDVFSNIVTTQTAFDALATKAANTLYLIPR